MNFEILRCFLSVARTLSFTQSAKELGLTQPSVSRQIRTLEEQLGMPLFIRDKHQVFLTASGKKLSQSLSPLLSQLEVLFQTTGMENAEIKGPIGFGCFPEIGRSWFVPKIIEFNLMYPGLNFRIDLSLQESIIEGIRSSRLDLGVVASPIVTDTIKSYPLFEEKVVMVTRSQNTESTPVVGVAHFVAYEDNDILLNRFLVQISKDIPARMTYVNSHLSMIDYLTAMNSYAVLPYFSVHAELEAGRLKLAHPLVLKNPFYLLMPEMPGAGIKVAPRVEALKKFLIAECKLIKW